MSALDEVILKIVKTEHPKNVREIVRLVQKQVDVSLADVMREIKDLQQKGLLALEEPTRPMHHFSDFLSSRMSLWFWAAVCLTIFGFVSILFFPETGTPLSYLRYALGFILAVFLPGYCLSETLFPRRDSLDEIERFTLSIGLSFAVTALVGLFLSFTPFGLTLTTALSTLGSIVIVLALVALHRKYRAEQ